MRILFLLFSFLFTSFFGYSQESIVFEHVGVSDKPIFTLIISKEKLVVESFANNLIVDKPDYINLEDIVCDLKNSTSFTTTEYGSFKISVHNDDKTLKSIIYLNRIDALNLFDKIIKRLKNTELNSEIKSEFEEIRLRIDL